MTPEELASYEDTEVPAAALRVTDLTQTSGTLTYGYTVHRHDWHAYLYEGEIHVLVTDWHDVVVSYEHDRMLPLELLRPSKRAYPDATSLEFAVTMRRRGYPLLFLGTFQYNTEDVKERQRRLERTGYAAPIHTALLRVEGGDIL